MHSNNKEYNNNHDVILKKYHRNWEKLFFHKNVSSNKYILMLFLTTGFFLAELIVGLTIGSIVLQADSFHMLGDSIALMIGFSSLKIKKSNKDTIATFGYLRAEIIASLVNSVFLLSMCFTITISAINSFFKINSKHDLESESLKLIIVSLIGLIINIIGMILFHNHQNNLNTKSVFLHILGDLLGSLVALVSGIIIHTTTGSLRFIVDPIGSLLIVIMIAYNSYKLLKKSIKILLHLVPIEINFEELKKDILKLENVNNIHNFHIWGLDQKIFVSTIHLELYNNDNFLKTIEETDNILKNYNIHYNTIQIDKSKNNCNNLLL